MTVTMSRSVVATLAIALATVGACGIHPGTAHPSGEGRLVTAEMIARSQARDGLEALRRTALSLRIDEGSGGVSIHMRGQSSAWGECLVMLNAAPLSSAGYLRRIPAAEIAAINILTPAQAMPHYGAPGGGGVIEVTMKAPREED